MPAGDAITVGLCLGDGMGKQLRVCLMAAALFAGACSTVSFKTHEEIIDLAARVCPDFFSQVTAAGFKRDEWKVTDFGSYWSVWIGDPKLPTLTIKVAKDGRAHLPGDCQLVVSD